MLITCVAYMNKRLMIWGNCCIILGFLIRTIRMISGGNADSELIALAWLTIILCAIGSIRGVGLLLRYNEENTAAVISVSSETIDKQGQMIDVTKEKFDVIESEVDHLYENIKHTESLMKEVISATGVINDNISDLSSASEEIAASSETAVTVSASAVEHMERVNHELRQVKKLAARLQNASEEQKI